MPAELRRLRRRLELHLAECEPTARDERESRIRDAMGPHDARPYQVTRLLHELAARQEAQAAELANLARLLGRPAEERTEGSTS